jgi:Tol biopolymer transport system component
MMKNIRLFLSITCLLSVLITTSLAAPLATEQTSLVNRKLSGEMPEFSDVLYGFEISPDSQRVFFTANKISPERLDLYSVPITGGLPLLLGEHIPGVEPSPDGKWVVFLSDAETPGLPQLYSMPAAGGDRVRLNADLPPSGKVHSFQISPDSQWVLYTATGKTDIELYSVPIEGGTPVFLDLYPANGYLDYRLTPDGSQLVYLVSHLHFIFSPLKSIPVQGGEATLLNYGSVEYESVSHFWISPDSSTVVFLGTYCAAMYCHPFLFNVPAVGGIPPAKISPDIVEQGSITGFEISPDGSRVVYLADAQVDEQFELYSVAVTGGAVTRLSGDMPPEGDVRSFLLSTDGSRVVYHADQEVDETYRLYSVPLDGSQPAIPLADMESDAWDQYQISPDGSKVVFARFFDDDLCHLYSMQIEGGELLDLTGNRVWGSCGVGEINPDSQRVTFSTGVGLYSVGLDGEGLLQLNSPLTEGGWINNFLVAPDSRHTVYRADQDTLQMLELYVTFEANNLYLPLLPGSGEQP